MALSHLSETEQKEYYNKFTKGFRIGDSVKLKGADRFRCISQFVVGYGGGNRDTLDDFVCYGDKSEIDAALLNEPVFALDKASKEIGNVNNLELENDGLFSADEYEKDNKKNILQYPEVDTFLAKHNLTIEEHYSQTLDEYKPCIVFNGKFIDNSEEAIRKLLANLLGYGKVTVKDNLSGNTLGTIASLPNSDAGIISAIDWAAKAYVVSNPITYKELWSKISREGDNNPEVKANSVILLYDTRKKFYSQCINYPTLTELYKSQSADHSIVRVGLSGDTLDMTGIQVGHNILQVASGSAGSIELHF